MTMGASFCPSCGVAAQPSARFCASCGQPLTSMPAATHPGAPVQVQGRPLAARSVEDASAARKVVAGLCGVGVVAVTVIVVQLIEPNVKYLITAIAGYILGSLVAGLVLGAIASPKSGLPPTRIATR